MFCLENYTSRGPFPIGGKRFPKAAMGIGSPLSVSGVYDVDCIPDAFSCMNVNMTSSSQEKVRSYSKYTLNIQVQ